MLWMFLSIVCLMMNTDRMLAQETMNICLLSEAQAKELIMCSFHREKLSPGLKKTIDSQTQQFPGLDVTDVMMLICKSVGDDGESVMEEFTDLLDESVRPELQEVFAKCMTEALAA